MEVLEACLSLGVLVSGVEEGAFTFMVTPIISEHGTYVHEISEFSGNVLEACLSAGVLVSRVGGGCFYLHGDSNYL